MAKSHIIIGLSLGLVMAQSAPPEVALGIVSFAMVGSVAPDIDHPKSLISQNVPLLGWILSWLPHRGPTHSLLFTALIWVASIAAKDILNPVYLQAAAVGYLSHLVTDAITEDGIAAFWPIPMRVWLLPPLLRPETGSVGEFIWVIILLVLVVLWHFGVIETLLREVELTQPLL